jgi:hypothetical protein
MPSSILNSDDGVISGTSGLKSSGGDDGVLVFQSKGTETARINTDKQIVAAAGTASLPALTTTGDVNTGIFFPAADTIAFAEGGAEAMRIDSSGNVGIGTTSPDTLLHLSNADGNAIIRLERNDTIINVADVYGSIEFEGQDASSSSSGVRGSITGISEGTGGNMALAFSTAPFTGTNTERMRIDSDGNLLVGKAAVGVSTVGGELRANGQGVFTSSGTTAVETNRTSNDGVLVNFRQDGTAEGNISVSGTTVSYNGGHLSRWAQTTTSKDESLKKGTVLSNLDEMNVYIAPTTYWTEDDELPEGVNVGDVKVETHEVQNEQLNKVKVSDVEGDANVAGVFVNWTYDEAHQVDEINMAMTGDMIIRIAEGVTVARGDLLMSAGDGTAKPQGDDIVRSKTIAKVTSTHVTCTYDDGSYCVPCVLMAC